MVFADSNIQLRRRSGAGFHGAWRSCQDLGSQHRGQDDVAQRAQTDSKERVEEEQIALTDTFVHPGTMMIPANDANMAIVAMQNTSWLLQVASIAMPLAVGCEKLLWMP